MKKECSFRGAVRKGASPRTFAGALLAAVLLAAAPARAAAPAADVPRAAPAPLPRLRLVPATLGQSALPGSGGGDLDFDLLGDSKPKERSAAELELDRQAGVRRTMLSTHQVVGLSTLTLLAATVVIGQLNYMDRFAGSAQNTARWETAHEVLAFTTLTGFAATGALGLLAPVPYPKKQRLDTTAVHKLCMAGATLGMMSELGLGLYTVGREGFANQKTISQIHQVIGFTTLGLMTIGASAFIF